MKDNITKISRVIDITDEYYDAHPDFIKFLEKLEKRSDLKGKIIQYETMIRHMEEKMKEKNGYLDIIKKAFEKQSQKTEIDTERDKLADEDQISASL